MKRALPIVVLLVAAVLLWIMQRSDAPQRAPHRDAAAVTDATVAPGDAALAAIEPPEAAPDETRAAVTSDVITSDAITTDASALAGRALADLVVLREGLDGPLFRDFEVDVIAADGALRTLRSTDAVEARDVTSDSLWILRLPGACPRFVDPNAIARGCGASADSAPLELHVIPSARLVVQLAPAPAGAAPIERVALHADSGTPLPRAWRQFSKGASTDYEQFLSEGRACRRLVDSAATDGERAAALQTLRASVAFAEVAADVAPRSFGFLLPWVARAEPASESITFEYVPTIAQLGLVFECADALEHDGAPSMHHRQRQQTGGGALTNLVLGRGETRVVNVRHVALGLVRGAFPVDARAPFHLEISIIDTSHGGRSTSMLGTWVPPPEHGGAFEIERVVPGHHRFAASWHTESGEQRWFQSEIDIAPGATHDFGTLVDASGALDLVLRLSIDAATSAAGLEPDLEGLACLVCVGSSDRFALDEPGEFVWLANDESAHIAELPVGDVGVDVLAVVRREATVEAAAAFAQRHGIERFTQGSVDVGSDMFVSSRSNFGARVPRDRPLELAVEVAVTGRVAANVFVPAEFVRPDSKSSVWFVRGGGADATEHAFTDWSGHPTGGGSLSGTFVLPVGEWSAFVRRTLPPTEAEPRHGVALGRVLVEAGATRPLAVELVRGATLDFPASAAPHLTGLGGGLELRDFPDWQYTPFSGAAVGERVLVPGLLPDTDHRSAKGDVVRTGPPGSTTVVE